MKNYDDGEDLNKGQIPESQYIPESTLVPESVSVIPDSEGMMEQSGGLPGGSAYGVKSKSKAQKSFVKRNLPFIVVGVLAAGIGGSMLMKSVQAPVVTQQMNAPEPAILPQEPVQTVSPQLSTQAPPVEMESVGGVAASPQAAVPPISAPLISAAGQVVPPLVVDLPEVKKDVGNGVVSQATKPEEKPSAVSNAVEKNFAANMSGKQDKSAVEDSKVKGVSAKECACAPEKSQRKLATKSAKQVAKKIPRSKTKKRSKKEMQNLLPTISEASGFNVHVIKNGLAWVRDATGEEVIVRVGDSIPGLGNVTKVDDRSMTVFVGGKRIEQN